MNVGFSKIDAWSTSTTSAASRSTTISTNTSWNTLISTTTSYNTSRSTSTNRMSSWSTSHNTTTSWNTSVNTTTTYNTSITTTTTWETLVGTSANTTVSWATSRNTTTSFNTAGNVQTGNVAYYYTNIVTGRSTTASWTTSWTTTNQTMVLTQKSMATLWTTSGTTSWNTQYSAGGNYYTSWTTSQTTDDGVPPPKCFVKGTLINISLTDTMLIEDLKTGDGILSMDCIFNTDDIYVLKTLSTPSLDGLKEVNEIAGIGKFYAIGTVIINEGSWITTQDHIHIVKRHGQWITICAFDLEIGDIFYKLDGTEVEINNIIIDTTTTY